MGGRGLELVARARPTFDGGLLKLTFALPSAAKKGDLLVVLIVRGGGVTAPAGWTQVENGLGSSTYLLDVFARLVDDDEPAAPVFTTADGAQDLQGQLLLFAVGTPSLVREASAHGTFAADATPPTPTVSSVQATNLLVSVVAATGNITFTAQSGFTLVDTYNTAIIASQSILVTYKRAGATGSIVSPDAGAAPAATGRTFTLVLRERAPVVPPELVDPVPGNIGLLPA